MSVIFPFVIINPFITTTLLIGEWIALIARLHTRQRCDRHVGISEDINRAKRQMLLQYLNSHHVIPAFIPRASYVPTTAMAIYHRLHTVYKRSYPDGCQRQHYTPTQITSVQMLCVPLKLLFRSERLTHDYDMYSCIISIQDFRKTNS